MSQLVIIWKRISKKIQQESVQDIYLNQLSEFSTLDIVEFGRQKQTGSGHEAPIGFVDVALDDDLLEVHVRLSDRP